MIGFQSAVVAVVTEDAVAPDGDAAFEVLVAAPDVSFTAPAAADVVPEMARVPWQSLGQCAARFVAAVTVNVTPLDHFSEGTVRMDRAGCDDAAGGRDVEAPADAAPGIDQAAGPETLQTTGGVAEVERIVADGGGEGVDRGRAVAMSDIPPFADLLGIVGTGFSPRPQSLDAVNDVQPRHLRSPDAASAVPETGIRSETQGGQRGAALSDKAARSTNQSADRGVVPVLTSSFVPAQSGFDGGHGLPIGHDEIPVVGQPDKAVPLPDSVKDDKGKDLTGVSSAVQPAQTTRGGGGAEILPMTEGPKQGSSVNRISVAPITVGNLDRPSIVRTMGAALRETAEGGSVGKADNAESFPARLPDQPANLASSEARPPEAVRAEAVRAEVPPAGTRLDEAGPLEARQVEHRQTVLQAVPALLVQTAQTTPDGPVTVTLAPEELGSVRFEMQTRGESLHISLLVERPETLELLRRYADQLVGEFRQAGFPAASFSFSGAWAGEQGQGGHEGGQSHGMAQYGVAVDPEPAGGAATRRHLTGGGLDLRL